MGVSEISPFTGERRREFMRALLMDLRAFERMLEAGAFEEGVARLGAEQEAFLIDAGGHPAPASMAVLEKLGDPHFTTELGLFQIEINADPLPFSGDSLSRLEKQLQKLVGRGREAAAKLGLDLVLTGILPTLRKTDLGLEAMTPLPRYHALNDATSRLRGEAYFIDIRGIDELRAQHDSVMVEACNASFQVHLQVGARGFAHAYNVAQMIAAPVLAAAANSPLLWGRRLWAETRIPLFEQAVDSRHSSQARQMAPRVTFGNRWVRRSILEIYREDIARFRALVGTDLDEDPLAALAAGRVPALKALRLHNGTIYRWNRACFGVTAGKPHLRIENRVLPSGPSVLDEVANGAFWLGLMKALPEAIEDVPRAMDFEHARHNFVTAARHGLTAPLVWLEGEEIAAPRLILERLLPAAASGLDAAGILPADRDRYLGVIERRVASGRNGARWALFSLGAMKDHGTPAERLNALTLATVARQKSGQPVADWEPARLDEGGGWKNNYLKVEQFMTTDLFTVHADDPVDLVARLMEWEKIRHVPVEDSEHRLVGLVSYRALLRLLASTDGDQRWHEVAVGDIMKRDPITVSPTMTTLRAIEVMREKRIGCLPVVSEGRLLGVVTEDDFMGIAGQLLEERLRG
jgi:CBS domain-containing protein